MTLHRQIAIADVRVPRGRRELRGIADLARSIRDVGLLNPITVTPEFRLIAGAHRLAACKSMSWERIAATVVHLSDLDRELAEIDENLIRNNGTALEQSEWLARRKDLYEAKHPETKKGGERGNQHTGGKKRQSETISFSQDTAAKAGVSARSVQHGVQIATNLGDKIKDAIRNTPTADSKTELLALSRMEPKEQAAVAKKLERGEAKDVREASAQLRRVERVEQIGEISKKGTPLTGALGRFPVIYADPPWQYDHQTSDNRLVENHYPTMSLEDICALPVQDIATPDAVVFLWATVPMMPEALQVMDAWGFKYRTGAVWVKDKIGMGFWFRQRHELLLIGVRGNMPTPKEADRPDSVIEACRGAHSVKPPIVYELIERMFPELKRLELFARTAREGWTAWGNEAGSAKGAA